MKVWMIVDKTEYALPVAVFSTLRECSEWLSVPIETLKTAFKRHSMYKGKHYNVEGVVLAEKSEWLEINRIFNEVMGFN